MALHVLQYRKHCAVAVSTAYCVSVRRCQSPNNPAKLLVAGYVGGEVHHILERGFPQSKLVAVFVMVDHRNRPRGVQDVPGLEETKSWREGTGVNLLLTLNTSGKSVSARICYLKVPRSYMKKAV